MFISEENLKCVTVHGIILSYFLFSCLKTLLREMCKCHSNNILYYYIYLVIDWDFTYNFFFITSISFNETWKAV